MDIAKPESKTVALRALLAPEEKDKLAEMAEYYEVTLSHVVRQLIRHGHDAMMKRKAEQT